MLTPAYRLTLGDRRIDTTTEPLASTVVRIEVRLDMEPAADRFELVFGRVGTFLPEEGDEAAIALGYAGEDQELVQVMAGVVDEVVSRPERVRITGLGGGATLARSRTSQSFRDKTAVEIVQALADEAGVDVARTGQSETLPYYVVDRRRSFLEHMADLATLTGFDLYQDAEDELIFEPFFNGQRLHPLRHARDVLDYHVERTPAVAESVEAFGESPGASAGAESWSWLTKDFAPRKGSAGTGSPVELFERSALRTPEAAQRAADARLAHHASRRMRGTVTVLGNPAIRLGDAIRLERMPEDDLNGAHQVRGVTHRIDKAGGFVTEVAFRAKGSTA